MSPSASLRIPTRGRAWLPDWLWANESSNLCQIPWAAQSVLCRGKFDGLERESHRHEPTTCAQHLTAQSQMKRRCATIPGETSSRMDRVMRCDSSIPPDSLSRNGSLREVECTAQTKRKIRATGATMGDRGQGSAPGDVGRGVEARQSRNHHHPRNERRTHSWGRCKYATWQRAFIELQKEYLFGFAPGWFGQAMGDWCESCQPASNCTARNAR